MRWFLVAYAIFTALAAGCHAPTLLIGDLTAERKDNDHVTAMEEVDCDSVSCGNWVHHCVMFTWAQGLSMYGYDDPDGGSTLVWDQQTVCHDRLVGESSPDKIQATSAVAIPMPSRQCSWSDRTCPTIRVVLLGPDGKPVGNSIGAFGAERLEEDTILSP